jgi:hypothetical protein
VLFLVVLFHHCYLGDSCWRKCFSSMVLFHHLTRWGTETSVSAFLGERSCFISMRWFTHASVSAFLKERSVLFHPHKRGDSLQCKFLSWADVFIYPCRDGTHAGVSAFLGRWTYKFAQLPYGYCLLLF